MQLTRERIITAAVQRDARRFAAPEAAGADEVAGVIAAAAAD